jgi:hypothetical protein
MIVLVSSSVRQYPPSCAIVMLNRLSKRRMYISRPFILSKAFSIRPTVVPSTGSGSLYFAKDSHRYFYTVYPAFSISIA